MEEKETDELVDEMVDIANEISRREGWSDIDQMETLSEFGKLLDMIPEFFEEEYRQDVPFRMDVLQDQIGDLERHVSHDPTLNPPTRPLEEEPEVSFGDSLAQLMVVGYAMGIDFDKAVKIGRERISGKEGYNISSGEDLVGLVGSNNLDGQTMDEYQGVAGKNIWVGKELTTDTSMDVYKYDLILTEVGGMTSHAGILSRENETLSILGVENLLDNVSDGDFVSVDLQDGTVSVE